MFLICLLSNRIIFKYDASLMCFTLYVYGYIFVQNMLKLQQKITMWKLKLFNQEPNKSEAIIMQYISLTVKTYLFRRSFLNFLIKIFVNYVPVIPSFYTISKKWSYELNILYSFYIIFLKYCLINNKENIYLSKNQESEKQL